MTTLTPICCFRFCLLVPASKEEMLDLSKSSLFGPLGIGCSTKRLLRPPSRDLEAIEPDAQIVLLLGIHQLLEMRVPVHAAINESVNLAKSKASKGSVGFVNAILRKVSAKSKEDWLDTVTAKMSQLDAL